MRLCVRVQGGKTMRENVGVSHVHLMRNLMYYVLLCEKHH
jgi:hypothetical protein